MKLSARYLMKVNGFGQQAL